MPPYQTILRNVTSEILETMFFLFLEPVEAENGPPAFSGEIPAVQARIVLQGPQPYMLVITVPLALAREMAANFLGQRSPELPIAKLNDIVKEFAQMVAGTFLTYLDNADVYRLQFPEVQPVNLEPRPAPTAGSPVRGEINGHRFEMWLVTPLPPQTPESAEARFSKPSEKVD